MVFENIKVSVIMPIYNVENFLEESMKSIINQTLSDIEIICVNDGSTDQSGSIIDRFAKKDPRIKVIHKKNTGYGNSMNIGLKNAKGKYIGILEPDDFISTNMLAELLELAEREHVDIVKSNFAYLEGEKGAYRIDPTRIYDDEKLFGKVLSVEEKKILFKGYVAHWSCLYKKDFLWENDIFFNETPGASYQDQGFWFQSLVYAQKIYMTNKHYYYYRQDNPNASIASKAKVYCISSEYDYIFYKLKKNETLFNEYLPIYIQCRYKSLRDTLDRIADEYKQEFILHISSDFNALESKGYLNTKYMDEQDSDKLFYIMRNPIDYYERIRKNAIYLHESIAPYKVIYIYGAGFMGRKILKKMFDKDREKVKGFLVTKNHENIKKVNGKEVYEFTDFHDFNEEVGIVVGVTKKFEEEIVQQLKLNNVHNIILPFEI